TSPEKQLEKINSLASVQGYQIDKKHVWRFAESGASRDRIGFKEALGAGGKGEISRVYVFNIDRLGRDLLEMLLFLRQLDEIGVDCWGAEKQQKLRDDDFILQIEGAVASKERLEIIKRTRDGLIRAIKDGKYSGGIITYGYCLNPHTKKLEIEKNEAEVVRQIFEWCVEERLSCIKISERLNALDIPTRYWKDGRMVHQKGKRTPEKTAGIWRAGRIRNMLRNPTYIGKWEWGKRSNKRKPSERIAGFSPALVSEEIFYRADEVLRSNQLWVPSQNRRKYLLRGLIRCGICGRTFCGSYSRVGPTRSKEKIYYRCNGSTQWKKLGIPKCRSLSLDGKSIEEVVWNDIKNFCKSPEVAIEQLREQRKPISEKYDDRISDIKNKLNELDRQEVNLIRIAAQSDEVNIDNLDKLLSEIHNSQESLIEYNITIELDRLMNSTLENELLNVAERLSKLGERIDQSSYEEKRRAVVELVKDIQAVPEIINGNQIPIVTITYRFNEPCPQELIPLPAVIQDCTPGRAAI
ncbi:recombinase family protein, partial [Chloroflexota bacterium]